METENLRYAYDHMMSTNMSTQGLNIYFGNFPNSFWYYEDKKNSQSFGRWNIALRETNIWSPLTPPFAISGPTLCDQCNFCWHAQHSGRDSHWKSEGIGDLLKVKPRVLFYLRDHLLGKGTICWEKRDHLLGKQNLVKKGTTCWNTCGSTAVVLYSGKNLRKERK